MDETDAAQFDDLYVPIAAMVKRREKRHASKKKAASEEDETAINMSSRKRTAREIGPNIKLAKEAALEAVAKRNAVKKARASERMKAPEPLASKPLRVHKEKTAIDFKVVGVHANPSGSWVSFHMNTFFLSHSITLNYASIFL